MDNIAKYIQGVAIEDGYYIDKNYGVSALYSIEPKPLFSVSDNALNTFKQLLESVLVGLSENEEIKIVGVQKSETRKPYKKDDGDLEHQLLNESIHYLNQDCIKQDLYLVLTVGSKQQRASIFDVKQRDPLDHHKQSLDQLKTNVQSSFNQLGCNITKLNSEAVFRVLRSCLKPTVRHKAYNPLYILDEQLIDSAVKEEKTYIDFGHTKSQTFVLDDCEKKENQWLLIQQLLHFQYSCSFYVSFKKGDINKQLKRVEHQSQIWSVLSKIGISDSGKIQGSTKAAMLTEVLHRLAEKSEPLYEIKAGINVCGEGDSESIKQDLFEKMKLYFIQPSFEQLNSLVSILPGQTHFNSYHTEQFSDQTVTFMPLGASWNGFSDDIEFKTSRKTTLGFSFFSHLAPAGHAIVVGGTGGGKSFFMCYILCKLLMKKTPLNVSIIDMGGSYRGICDAFKGSYIDVEIGAQYAIQLFPPKHRIFVGDTIDSDQLSMLASYISILVLDNHEELSKQQLHVIHITIMDMYTHHKEPMLVDFVNSLSRIINTHEQKIATVFIKNLQLYVDKKEPLSQLFTVKPTLNLDNPFLVFDITRLKDHPQIAALYLQVISNTLRLRMFSNDETKVPQIIIRDEVWALFDNPQTAQLINEEYRTARKYNSCLVSVSQLASDFTSENTASVLKNSYTKFILQNNEQDQELEKLGLCDQEIRLAKQVKRYGESHSHVLLKYADIATEVLHIEPTPTERDLCTRKVNQKEDVTCV